MNKTKTMEENIIKTGIKTIIILERDFENIKPLPAFELSKGDDSEIHRLGFSKLIKEFLERNGISVKEFPERREPRGKSTIIIAGHTLHLISDKTYEYYNLNKDAARVAFHQDINPALKLLGYFNTKAKCINTFEGETEDDCMNENLNKFKEGNQ